MKTLLRDMTNLFFTPRCFNCGAEIKSSDWNLICLECADATNSFETDSNQYCRKCGRNLYHAEADLCYYCREEKSPISRFYSFYSHKDPLIHELVRRFKFDSNRKAGQDLSALLKKPAGKLIKNLEYDIIIPVPLSRHSLRKRGFNQVTFLLDKLEWEYTEALERSKHSGHQSRLSPEERRESIREQFKVKKGSLPAISGKKILLVDDIYTTGATCREVSELLLRSGARRIEVLTFFRA